MLVIAHRGPSHELQENMLPAFERAIELGADYIELDVHADRDGRIVVTHDPPRPRAAYPTLVRPPCWRRCAPAASNSSTGPELRSVAVEEPWVTVECSPATSVTLVSRRGRAWTNPLWTEANG